MNPALPQYGQPVPEFQTYASYDTPQLLMSMAFDGELTAAGVSAATWNPGKLTPKERSGIADRLKESMGRSTVGNIFADLVTNPFVWLLFVTSPAGSAALKKAGAGAISRIAPEATAYMNKDTGVLRTMGLNTNDEVFRSSAVGTIMGRDFTDHLANGVREWAGRVHDAEQKVLDSLARTHGLDRGKLDSLQWSKYADGSKEQEVVKGFSWLMTHSMEEADKPIRRIFLRDGKVAAAEQAVKIADNLDDRLREYTGDDSMLNLKGAWREAMMDRVIQLFGKEGIGRKFEADATKINAVARGVRNRAIVNPGAYDGGYDFIRHAVSGDIAEMVRLGPQNGGWSEAEFGQFLEKSFASMIGDGVGYMPRNLRERYLDGAMLTPGAQDAARLGRAVRATPSAMPRVRIEADYLPEDVQFGLDRGLATPTPRYLEMLESAKGRMEIEDAAGMQHSWLRMDAAKSVDLYERDTARTYAMHVAEPSAEALRMNKESVERVGAYAANEREQYLKVHPDGRAIDVNLPMEDQRAQFFGGKITNADLIYGDVVRMQNKYSRELLSKYYIPAITGNYRTDHLTSYAALMGAKRTMGALADSFVGKTIESFGERGKGFVQDMRKWADPTLGATQVGESLATMARFLYATHLSFNAAAAMLNLTQPFLLASNVTGGKNIAVGYARALKEEFGYLSERASQGFKRLGPIEHDELLAKHFKYYKEMGIGPDAFSTADAVSFRRELTGHSDRGWFSRTFFERGMAGFQTAERINRNVTAHALEGLYSDLGLVPAGEGFLQDVRTVIRQTQFGGGKENTPVAFLTGDSSINRLGPVLANPLGRMFLPFMTRSFTGQFSEIPRLGEGLRTWGLTGITTSSRGAAIAHDWLRMMGNSAVLYEVGKNAFGVDLSGALGFAASTQLLGGQRVMGGDSVVPIPPVIDILADSVKAVTTEDQDLWARTAARLVPGGLGLQRVLGTLPRASAIPGVAGLQRSFVDWGSPSSDGSVPMYDGKGSLVGYDTPASIVMRGLGVDMGQYRQAGELDGYLVKQRDLLVGYRRDAIDRIMNNDMAGFRQVADEYTRRTGMPLTISKSQMQGQVKLREVGRPERMIDRLPEDVRPLYAAMVARSQPGRLGLPPDQLVDVPNAAARQGRVEGGVGAQARAAAEQFSLPGSREEDSSFQAYPSGFERFGAPRVAGR